MDVKVNENEWQTQSFLAHQGGIVTLANAATSFRMRIVSGGQLKIKIELSDGKGEYYPTFNLDLIDIVRSNFEC